MKVKHGHARNGKPRSSEYYTWRAMIRRCELATNSSFAYYGARGVKVCERWRGSFVNFLADMGMKPTRAHTIDRINSNGNYEPANCRWATPTEQRKNQRPYDESARLKSSWASGKRSHISKRRIDLTGRRFNHWLVIAYSDTSPSGHARWLSRCDCGTEIAVFGSDLLRDRTANCGCEPRRKNNG
jgi:hypothetical protein